MPGCHFHHHHHRRSSSGMHGMAWHGNGLLLVPKSSIAPLFYDYTTMMMMMMINKFSFIFFQTLFFLHFSLRLLAVVKPTPSTYYSFSFYIFIFTLFILCPKEEKKNVKNLLFEWFRIIGLFFLCSNSLIIIFEQFLLLSPPYLTDISS